MENFRRPSEVRDSMASSAMKYFGEGVFVDTHIAYIMAKLKSIILEGGRS